MLKAADALLEPDPRFRDFVFRDGTIGASRPMCMDDLRNMVAKIELSARIPAAIRKCWRLGGAATGVSRKPLRGFSRERADGTCRTGRRTRTMHLRVSRHFMLQTLFVAGTTR
jgi:hypothetical protein